MNKIIFPLLISILLLTSPLVFANGVNESANESQTGAAANESLISSIATQAMARNVSELKEMVAEKKAELNQSITGLERALQNVYENQNKVALAVHTLLLMENLTGGIGQNVSAIAREYNNSVQATISAEERIATRNAIVRFFMGGDEQAAAEIENETAQNHVKIQELKQLKEECNCTEEVKAVIEEQIGSMKIEEARLNEVAQSEQENKGVFGSIVSFFAGLFKK